LYRAAAAAGVFECHQLLPQLAQVTHCVVGHRLHLLLLLLLLLLVLGLNEGQQERV
jgi:hypothetical protein